MISILLINPSHRNDILENVQILALPPMNLALLASMTPAHYEIRIIDEAVEDIDFDTRVDLVGITCMTCLAPRAYEIAQKFRERNIPVVLGGIHPSMCSEEALAFADAVVIGEAEPVWEILLEDVTAGRLRRRYQGQPGNIENLPTPRRDLLNKHYFVHTVQTSRGCPFDCTFCSVTRFNGGQYRFRSVDRVINEIADLPGKQFIFLDDNIIGTGSICTKRALTLFNRLADLDKQWGSQICINIADDDRLLRAMAKSGAKWLYIGFESIETATLSAMNKRINLRAAKSGFGEAIKRIQDHGIAV